MIYTMNGMATELNLRADAPGTFRGLSSHYSGEGFSDMHFQVDAMAPAQFSSWTDATRGAGATLDGARYATLAAQSVGDAPAAFGNVDPDLFDRIVRQAIAPGAGPARLKAAAVQAPSTEK
jgi:cytochrome o ubiquinol oxidase subunit 2